MGLGFSCGFYRVIVLMTRGVMALGLGYIYFIKKGLRVRFISLFSID